MLTIFNVWYSLHWNTKDTAWENFTKSPTPGLNRAKLSLRACPLPGDSIQKSNCTILRPFNSEM